MQRTSKFGESWQGLGVLGVQASETDNIARCFHLQNSFLLPRLALLSVTSAIYSPYLALRVSVAGDFFVTPSSVMLSLLPSSPPPYVLRLLHFFLVYCLFLERLSSFPAGHAAADDFDAQRPRSDRYNSSYPPWDVYRGSEAKDNLGRVLNGFETALKVTSPPCSSAAWNSGPFVFSSLKLKSKSVPEPWT